MSLRRTILRKRLINNMHPMMYKNWKASGLSLIKYIVALSAEKKLAKKPVPKFNSKSMPDKKSKSLLDKMKNLFRRK